MPLLEEELTCFYRIAGWAEDPYSDAGRKRYENSLKKFRQLIEHEWLKDLLKTKQKLKILDLCGGTGIGGIALSKILKELGIDIKLTIIDLREDALRIAEKWGMEELDDKVEVIKVDARSIHELGIKEDLILLYGFSMPHFNVWETLKLFASVSEALTDDGLFLVEEIDRRYTIFYLAGYKDVLPEAIGNGKVTISLHHGYDISKGVFKRSLVNLLTGEMISHEFFFWGIAELAALMWIFFKDVDFSPHIGGIMRGFLLGKNPRRKLKLNDLVKLPKLLKR